MSEAIVHARLSSSAVPLVVSGKPAMQVAKDRDLTEATLRECVRRAEADAGVGSPMVLMTEEWAEGGANVVLAPSALWGWSAR